MLGNSRIRLLYFAATIPEIRNSTPYQRIVQLSSYCQVYLISCAEVPHEVRDKCEGVFQAPFRTGGLNRLIYPLWAPLIGLHVVLTTGVHLVVSMYPNWSLLCGALFKLFGYRWAADIFDDPFLWIKVNKAYPGIEKRIGLIIHWLFYHLLRCSLKLADLVILAGSSEWLSGFQVDRDRIVEVPNGVDVEWIDSISSDPIPKARNVTRLCYVGHIRKARGADLLLDVARRLKERNMLFELVLVGPTEPKEEQWLTNTIRDYGLHGNILRTGRVQQDKVIAWIRSSDICLYPFPRLKELEYVYPIKVFEYLACGKATVASRLKTVETFLHDRKNAILFTPGDPKSMTKSIEAIVRDSCLRRRLEHNATETASMFDWNAIMVRVSTKLLETARV